MIVEYYDDVIILTGALRSNFWETIHTAISLTLKKNPAGVIIDCSGITECTEQGADTFIDVMGYIGKHDARILVAAVPDHVYAVLKSVPEVRSQLPIVGSVEEARKSLEAMPLQDKKKNGKGILNKMLVCLSGQPSDKFLTTVCEKVAQKRGAKLYFVYPIIVPRELPLQASMPDQEEEAKRAFEKVNEQMQNSSVIYESKIERARDVTGVIILGLDEIENAQVYISLQRNEDLPEYNQKLVKSVLSKVKQTVYFVAEPME